MTGPLVTRAPNREDIERQFVGALIFKPELVGGVELPADRLYHIGLRRVYTLVREMVETRKPVSLLTLKTALGDDLIGYGGPPWLASLIDLSGPATAEALDWMADQIERDAASRDLLAGAGETLKQIERGEDPEEIAAKARARLDSYRVVSDGGYATLASAADGFMDDFETAVDTEDGVTGIGSGLVDVDTFTGGFRAGDLIVLAARPSMGKSALAMQFALHAAMQADEQVGYVSLEMSRRSLFARAVASLGRIDLGHILRGRVGGESLDKVVDTVEALRQVDRLHIDEARQPVTTIRSRACALAARYGLGMLVVDHLQIVSKPRGEDVYGYLREASAGLKQLAKDLEIPVLLLSQLNRKCEDRIDKRPNLADLRESGSIEQDADTVIALYREELYNRDDDSIKGLAELIFLKNRNGPTGVCDLAFIKEFTRFESLAQGGGYGREF